MADPSRHNLKWDEVEEKSMISRFQKKIPIQHIAELHGRTELAIECRLEKLGFIRRDSQKGYTVYKTLQPESSKTITSSHKQALLLNQGISL